MSKYHKWRFILKPPTLHEGKDYIEAYFTDEEILKMKKESPEVKWSD